MLKLIMTLTKKNYSMKSSNADLYVIIYKKKSPYYIYLSKRMDKMEIKRKQMNTNAARYYYKKQDDVLQKHRDKYDQIKEY